MVKNWLIKQLRRMLHWLGGEETDVDYRGRQLNMVRRRPGCGSGMTPEFDWTEDRRALWVVWR